MGIACSIFNSIVALWPLAVKSERRRAAVLQASRAYNLLLRPLFEFLVSCLFLQIRSHKAFASLVGFRRPTTRKQEKSYCRDHHGEAWLLPGAKCAPRISRLSIRSIFFFCVFSIFFSVSLYFLLSIEFIYKLSSSSRVFLSSLPTLKFGCSRHLLLNT